MQTSTEIKKELPKWLPVAGVWLLAISWPYLSMYLTIYQFDFIGKAYSSLMNNHNVAKVIITPLIHYVPSFAFLYFLPYGKQRNFFHGLLLFLIHGVLLLALMLAVSSGTRA